MDLTFDEDFDLEEPIADLDHDPYVRRHRGGAGKWVALLLLTAMAGAGITYMLWPALFAPLLKTLGLEDPPQLAVHHVLAGYEQLRRDSRQAMAAAQEEFEQAIDLAHGYPAPHAGMAVAYLALADADKAEAELLRWASKTGEADKRGAADDRAKGLMDSADKRAKAAFNTAKEALKLDPSSPEAIVAMADYYRFKGAAEQMESLLGRLPSDHSPDPGVHWIRGAALLGDSATEEQAIGYLSRALEERPGLQRARYALAQRYASQGHNDKARTYLETLLQAVPEHGRASKLLDVIAATTHDGTQADAARSDTIAGTDSPVPDKHQSDEVTVPSPTDPEASFERSLRQAERLRRADQTARALDLYEQALELQPNNPEVLAGLGWCYFDLENYGAAIASFRKVTTHLPRFSDAHMGLAESYRAKGMKREALEHYRTYLDILPNGPEAPVARRMIETLK